MTAIPAKSALAFSTSVGVNTNVGANDSAYKNAAALENALAFLGIQTARNTIYNPNDPAQLAQINADLGIKFDLFISAASTGFDWQLQQIMANPAIVAYVEGPNESDMPGGTQFYQGSSGLPATLAEMQTLYASIRADPRFARIPVIQTSFGAMSNMQLYGDHGGTADVANAHLYFGAGDNPGRNNWINTVLATAQIVTPSKPIVVTETGYETLPGDPYAVSKATQAKYLLNDLLDTWKAGVTASFAFALVDDGRNVGPSARSFNYGLFNSDWTAKPAALALHNLLAILADGSSGTVPTGSLDYTLSGMPAGGNSVLLEKSDGTFVLALWNDVRVTGATSLTDVNVPAVPVTLTLALPASRITIFDPLSGTSAVSTSTGASSIQVMLPDHPVLLEIGPGAAPISGTNQPVVEAPTQILAALNSIVPIVGIRVVGNATNTLTVQISDRAGTLTMRDSNGQGLAGSGTSGITLNGSLTVINTELATLSYRMTGAGADSIVITAITAAGLPTSVAVPVVHIELPLQQLARGPLLSLHPSMTVAPTRLVAIPDAVLTDIYYAEHPGQLSMTISVSGGLLQMLQGSTPLPGSPGITVTGSYADLVEDLASLSYRAPAATGVATLSLSVSDPAGLSASAIMVLNTATPLQMFGPGPLTVIAGQSRSTGTTLRLVDTAGAANGDMVQVVVADTNGRLSMQDGNGRLLMGSGISSIRIGGTPNQVNAILATLVYFAGPTLASDTITVTASDQQGDVASYNVPIAVVPNVILAGPSGLAARASAVIRVDASVTDSFAAAGQVAMTVTITDSFGRLSALDAFGNVVAGSGGNALVLSGTLDSVNTSLATLTYTAPSSALGEALTITATDTGGGRSSSIIQATVVSATTLPRAFQVADTSGHVAAYQPVLSSGAIILTGPATGLAGNVSETVLPTGTAGISSLAWGVVNAISVIDTTGGSYSLSNFAWVSASLSGGPTVPGKAQSLTIQNALAGNLTLGAGSHSVTINAGLGGGPATSSNMFTINTGGGTDDIVVNGYANITKVSVTAGAGIQSMQFINVSAVAVAGGAGNLTVHGSQNGNSISAGTGTMDVSGGVGADAFKYHVDSGMMKIEDFGANDLLFIDKRLQLSMITVTNATGAILKFGGDPTHEILLAGLGTVPMSRIAWT